MICSAALVARLSYFAETGEIYALPSLSVTIDKAPETLPCDRKA
jgi:hypothetical protein